MKKRSFNCIACNEKIEISANVTAFNCASCNTHLSVEKNNNGIVYLIPKSEVNKTIKGDAKALLLEQEIGRIDREWILKREAFPHADRIDHHGKRGTGERIFSKIIAISLFTLLGIGCVKIYQNSNLSDAMAIFYKVIGAIILVMVVLSILSGYSGEDSYSDAKEEYLAKRGELMREIENIKSK